MNYWGNYDLTAEASFAEAEPSKGGGKDSRVYDSTIVFGRGGLVVCWLLLRMLSNATDTDGMHGNSNYAITLAKILRRIIEPLGGCLPRQERCQVAIVVPMHETDRA